MNGYACRFHLHVYRRYCQEAAAFFRAITVHISQVLCLRPADCQSGRGFHVHGGGTVCCSKNWRMVPHLEAQTFEPWLHSRISNHNETRCMGMEIELRWMEVTAFCHEPLSESDFGFIIKNNNTASWLVGKDWHKVPQLHFWTFKRNQPIARKTFIVIGFLFGLGDYLEMRSLVSLNGGAYQILLQSRLLITALMLWAISGQRQTLFQWNLLALVVCSMSVYMCSWPASAWTVFNWLFLTTTYNFLQSFFPTKMQQMIFRKNGTGCVIGDHLAVQFCSAMRFGSGGWHWF